MHKPYTVDKMFESADMYWPETSSSVNRIFVCIQKCSQLHAALLASILNAHGLTVSGFSVLSTLRNQLPPYQLSPLELRRSILMSSGGLTKLLYQLEEKGLVLRLEDKDDLRSKVVSLTSKGQELIETLMDLAGKNGDELLAGTFSNREVALLEDLLSELTRLLEAQGFHSTPS